MSLLIPRALPDGAVKLDKRTFSEPHIHRFGEQFLDVADRQGGKDLVLDLADVSRLNGMALGKLVLLHRTLRRRGVRLTLVNLDPQLYEVFAVTGLHRVLNLRAKQAG